MSSTHFILGPLGREYSTTDKSEPSTASKTRIVGYRGPERDHVISSQILLPSSRQHLLPSELFSFDCEAREQIEAVLLSGALSLKQCGYVEARLLPLFVLWTSSSALCALEAVWIDAETQLEGTRLAVVNSSQPALRIMAKVPKTDHDGVPARIARAQINYFLAPDTAEIAALIKHYLELRSAAFGQTLTAGTKVFVCDPLTLQRDAQELLRTLSPTGRLTMSRLSEVLFRYLAGWTGFDVVLTATCTDGRQAERLAGSGVYYMCRAEDFLQARYASGVRALRSAIRSKAATIPDDASPNTIPNFDFEYGGRFIGISGLPSYPNLRELVHNLLDALLSCPISTRDGRFTYCNLWCCYNIQYNRLGGPTFRPVTYAVLRPNDISPFDDFAQICDKGRSRLVAVDAGLREQTDYNAEHSKKFGRTDWSAFLRGPQGEFLQPSPSLIWEHTSQFFPVPLWVTRAFVYSHLLDAGAAYEDVSTLCMDHGLIGHSATDDHSTLVFHDAVRRILPYIKELLDYLGFRPVKSRLV